MARLPSASEFERYRACQPRSGSEQGGAKDVGKHDQKDGVLNITIKTIPHLAHRPEAGRPTIGDWTFEPNGDLTIRVSDLGDARYEALIGIHEMVEALLCRQRGISGEAVDEFDRTHAVWGEPGDHAEAPYRKEHFFATSVERLVAAELGVNWPEYEQAIEDLTT